jgi:N-acetyl-anhydromuramyl-L-alanine amidase AmpD
MNIRETNLKFNGSLKKRRLTNRIIIHHSDSDQGDAAMIHGWHLGQNWAGIGYHYVILKDGTVERGRPEGYIGSHSGSAGNSDSIGICLIGKFMVYEPTEAQIQSLVALIRDIESRFGDLDIIGHKDVMATACPGILFPWVKLWDMLKGGEEVPEWMKKIIDDALAAGLITERHNPTEPATKWFVLAIALNLLKIVKGGR